MLALCKLVLVLIVLLSGTIPRSIFSKQWASLDLSFNRLTGEIHPHINVTANTSLTFQVNRLSGRIPAQLIDLQNINVLNGNVFECGLLVDRALPVHDDEYSIYQCGSDSFEQSVIIWAVCAGLIMLFIALFALYFRVYGDVSDFLWVRQTADFAIRLTDWHRVLKEPRYNLIAFGDLMVMFRRVVLLLTVIICVVGFPLYSVLSVYFKTLTSEYAWVVSAAYLSGEVPALVLFSLYILWFCFLFLVWRFCTQLNVGVNVVDVARNPTRGLLLSLVNIVNTAVVIVVNACYVYVILNNSRATIFFAQVCVALFKLLWNDFAVRGMMHGIRRWYIKSPVEVVRSSAAEMPTMTFIVLFNTIIAPCLATAVIDPSCFVNAFIQPATVKSVFPNYGCSVVTIQNGDCNLGLQSTAVTISYDPPFIYNYQCTSAILTNYASVYVYMFLFVAFGKPLLVVFMERFYQEIPRGSILHSAVSYTIYNMLKPADAHSIDTNKMLFRKERFVLRLLSKLAVFLTFGVVFPPLTVVLCVAFYSETYLNEVIMGRFLSSIADETLRLKYACILSRDCEGAMELLIKPLLMRVVPFAAFFYAFFVFDMYGDQVGWMGSVWAAVVMTATPGLIWFGYALCKLYLHCYNGTTESKVKVATNANVANNPMQAIGDGEKAENDLM